MSPSPRRSNTPGERSAPSQRLLTAEAALYLVWWICLIESSAFIFHQGAKASDPLDGILAGYALSAAGIIGGSLAFILARRFGKERLLSSPLSRRILLAVELTASTTFYLAGGTAFIPPIVAALLLGCLGACMTANIVAIMDALRLLDMRRIIAIATVCLAAGAAAGAATLSTIPLLSSPALFALPSVLLLAGAFFLGQARLNRETSPARTAPVIEGGKTPATLAFSLVSYGLVFGLAPFLKASAGSTVLSSPLIILGSAALCVLILAALFLWRRPSIELWSKFRGTALPLLLIGLTLCPTAWGDTAASALLGAGEALFFVFLAAFCADIMQLTALNAQAVVPRALIWNSLGVIGGVLISAWGNAATVSNYFPLLEALVVLLLCGGTLWIGSDEQIRKNWDLRRKMTPKQFNDAAMRQRCETLAKAHQLTPRETEMVTALALGRRPSDIQAEQGVTIHTVRAHIQHAYGKMGIHSVSELQDLLKSVPLDEARLSESGDSSSALVDRR